MKEVTEGVRDVELEDGKPKPEPTAAEVEAEAEAGERDWDWDWTEISTTRSPGAPMLVRYNFLRMLIPGESVPQAMPLVRLVERWSSIAM